MASDETSAAGPGTLMRIALMRLGGIGDALCALPAAFALKRAYPGAEIRLLTQRMPGALAERAGCIDRVVSFDRLYGAGPETLLRPAMIRQTLPEMTAYRR